MIAKILLPLFLFPFIAAQINHRECHQTCDSNHTLQSLPYPFGFSSGCAIRLNCNPDGGIAIGEYTVESINPDSIIVAVKSKCDRPIASIHRLFTQKYAPTSRNAFLLQDCNRTVSSCVIPATMMQTHFESQDCSPGGGNLSCYYENSSIGFMSYRNLTKSRCEYLMFSIAAEDLKNTSGTGTTTLEAETIELGWWLDGECRCSDNANCAKLESPFDGKPGYRCRCNQGFDGDGYSAGKGCRKGYRKGKTRKSVEIIAATVFAGAVVGALIIVIYCFRRNLFFDKTKLKAHKDFEAFLKRHGPLAIKRYSYSEIKNMTNSFKENLGKGGYGSVFKGMLHDKRLVAVKILNETKGNGEDFINEVASISRTSHVNIVTLLGFCFEGSKKALVYEFMANGSLEKFIYANQNNPPLQLCCNTLYQIAMGVARGLEYLHRGCNTRILHFDIKPHNILLDENFFPKISDFGLAKICPQNESIVSMLCARGTIGYIAPEVACRAFGEVSHKSDVFSFGMMVLEMVGGRRNVDVEVDRTSEIYFPRWIYKRVKQNQELSLEIIGNGGEKEKMRQLVIVSLWCIQTDPSHRPMMSKVVEMLEGRIEALQMPPKPYLSSP